MAFDFFRLTRCWGGLRDGADSVTGGSLNAMQGKAGLLVDIGRPRQKC